MGHNSISAVPVVLLLALAFSFTCFADERNMDGKLELIGTLSPPQPKGLTKAAARRCTRNNRRVVVPLDDEGLTFTNPSSRGKCGWKFVAPPGATLSITCTTFDLPNKDSVTVKPKPGRDEEVYLNQSGPNKEYPGALRVLFVFRHRNRKNPASFSCQITATLPTTTTDVTSTTTTVPTTTTDVTSTTTAVPTTTTDVTSTTTAIPTTTTDVTSTTTAVPTTTTDVTSTTTAVPTTTTDVTSTTTAVPTTTTDVTSTTTAVPTNTGSVLCKCGIANRANRIVGGVEVEINEYPWQVGLMPSTGFSVFCGGTLISDRYILTAAHCTVGRTPSSMMLLLGGHWVSSETPTEILVNPLRIINHPQYDAGTVDYDIALIEISPLNFSDPSVAVRPACLPDSASLYEGVDAIVSGWGTLSAGGSQPDTLMEVTVPTWTNADCKSVYGDSAITSRMICAGGLPAGGTDSCQGDSGGPLIAPDGANYELIGIVSWGSGCGDPSVPGVYTRVTDLQSWVTSNTAGSTTCGR